MVDVQNAYKRLKYEIQTREEFIEQIRKQMVQAMRKGKTLVLNLGSELPNLHTFNSKDFPLCKLLNAKECFDSEVYMKIVKEDEKVDMFGEKAENFFIQEGFSIVLVSSAEERYDAPIVEECVPNHLTMSKLHIMEQ